MVLAEKFITLFQGLMRAHGTYQIQGKNDRKNKMEGRARTLALPVTLKLWEDHLNGKAGLGIVPIDDNGLCHWGAIDVDVYDGLNFKGLEDQIKNLKLPLIVLRTKSGGAHLYLFMTDPAPAKLIREKLMEWSISLGHPGVEVFPKQVKLAGEGDIGNWINMPYFDHERTLRYAYKNHKPLTAGEFLDFAGEMAVDEATLEKITVPVNKGLEKAPPCIQFLASTGFPDGTRNNGLFNLGVYAKKAHGDNWEEKLDEMNRDYMSPPLTSKEVLMCSKSLSRKDYFYKCDEPPLSTCCNKAVCLGREHGIGSSNDPGVCLNSLTKILTQPPTWIVDVDGARVQINNTADLLNQNKFRVLCMERLDVLPSLIKGKAWENIIQELLQKVEIVEAPEDAGVEGQFLYLVEQFCTDRGAARTKEELILGKPWTDKGRVYFRSGDLMKFLDTNRFKGVNGNKDAWAFLRKAGADSEQFNIKGKCIRCWSVPEFSKQIEDFDTPHAEHEVEF